MSAVVPERRNWWYGLVGRFPPAELFDFSRKVDAKKYAVAVTLGNIDSAGYTHVVPGPCPKDIRESVVGEGTGPFWSPIRDLKIFVRRGWIALPEVSFPFLMY